MVPARQQIELWDWTLAPGERYEAEPDPEGWYEMLYVIKGELTLSFQDEDVILLAGESFTFDSSVNYGYANLHTDELHFLRNAVK